ncbi:hypothetical protein F5148DRAFT_1170605 [Russula earlei]|uniref:Uncharacterized protein n=1 Tax=Russula earlei TaxID=71964 RepID=A0ACC0UK61_9AGAM|nr:hypothetical protein F5148DRAFT_1170605 [Russula earlei]
MASSSHTPSELSPPPGVPLAPAPWVLKTKLYLFTTIIKPTNRDDPVLQGLPPGSYVPGETVHPSALAPIDGAPQWKGGMMSVVLVRYEESPVGPYDELIFVSVADGFRNPYEKGTSGRITNIYVSSRGSVWNGRRNWNIPKHLARFEFTPTGSKSSTIKVFLPDAEKPFFAATVTDSYIPGIPIPARLLNPLMRIVQPPLLAGSPQDIQIETTDDWVSITPAYHGSWRIAYIRQAEPDLELYGDGLQFPRIKPFWIGAKFTGTIHFPEGVKVKKKTE